MRLFLFLFPRLFFSFFLPGFRSRLLPGHRWRVHLQALAVPTADRAAAQGGSAQPRDTVSNPTAGNNKSTQRNTNVAVTIAVAIAVAIDAAVDVTVN